MCVYTHTGYACEARNLTAENLAAIDAAYASGRNCTWPSPATNATTQLWEGASTQVWDSDEDHSVPSACIFPWERLVEGSEMQFSPQQVGAMAPTSPHSIDSGRTVIYTPYCAKQLFC